MGSWVEIMSKRTTFSRCFLYMLFDFWWFLELRSCFCTLSPFLFNLHWPMRHAHTLSLLQTSITVRIFYSKSWLAQPLNFGIMKLIVEISLLIIALEMGLFLLIHLCSTFIFMHPVGPTKDYSRVCAWEHVFYYIFLHSHLTLLLLLFLNSLLLWVVHSDLCCSTYQPLWKGPIDSSHSPWKLGRTHPDFFFFRMSQ